MVKHFQAFEDLDLINTAFQSAVQIWLKFAGLSGDDSQTYLWWSESSLSIFY